MMKVTLVEYLNYVNDENQPVGHGKKVLQQMANLLSMDFSIECICSESYLPLGFQKCRQTPIEISQKDKSIKQINNAVFKNLKICESAVADSDIIWFTNSDWHLMAFLPFFNTKKRKIIVTAYRDIRKDVADSKSRLRIIKKSIVEKGISRVNLFVITNENLKLSNNQLFIPDYICDKSYDMFVSPQKIDRILCVGAMRKSKDLLGVIKHFRETDIPVYITGGFQDKEWFNKLKDLCSSNIQIEDRMVPYEEYYSLIGESRFTIMPYDMTIYDSATSGILQEAIFLGSIPIAPKRLLDYNGINGIGYEQLEELPTNLEDMKKNKRFMENDLSKYMASDILLRIKTKIEELSF